MKPCLRTFLGLAILLFCFGNIECSPTGVTILTVELDSPHAEIFGKLFDAVKKVFALLKPEETMTTTPWPMTSPETIISITPWAGEP